MLLFHPLLMDRGSRSWLPTHSTDQRTSGESLFFSVMTSPILTRDSTQQVSSVLPDRSRTWRSIMLRLYERATGIGPAWPAWRAGALPLSHARRAVPGLVEPEPAVAGLAARRTGASLPSPGTYAR